MRVYLIPLKYRLKISGRSWRDMRVWKDQFLEGEQCVRDCPVGCKMRVGYLSTMWTKKKRQQHQLLLKSFPPCWPVWQISDLVALKTLCNFTEINLTINILLVLCFWRTLADKILYKIKILCTIQYIKYYILCSI